MDIRFFSSVSVGRQAGLDICYPAVEDEFARQVRQPIRVHGTSTLPKIELIAILIPASLVGRAPVASGRHRRAQPQAALPPHVIHSYTTRSASIVCIHVHS
jgi:hypothetical protein